MRYTSIKNHLQPYVIKARRASTVNHAFAAAIAPSDDYDENRVRQAIYVLHQDPDRELECVYCGVPAETWDHVFATVEKTQFSGNGHRLGNLLPCCKDCNSKKGNRGWRQFLAGRCTDEVRRKEREQTIEAYLSRYHSTDVIPPNSPEYERLREIRLEVLRLFGEADEVASKIREHAKSVGGARSPGVPTQGAVTAGRVRERRPLISAEAGSKMGDGETIDVNNS